MCRRRRLSKTLLLSPLVSHLLFLLILLLLFPLQPTSTAAATSEEKDPRAIDREALLQFKAAVTSDPAGALSEWSNSPNSDPCSWPGVSCDSGSRVSALNISGCGESPSCSYSALSHPLRGGRLAARWDQTKRLVGRLPPALGKLSALRVLALPFHGFQGELPVEVSGSRSLLVLDLRGNSLSGPVPLKFGPFLRVVHLGLNNFSGAIPESLLSGSPDLETVNFSHNELNGTIPPSFGRLVKLKWLSLSSNYLSGRIPAALGNGGCWSLEHLDLSGNFLVSGIPDSLGNCSSLRSLLLFRNLLDDVIPASLGKLANLEALDVSMNSLSGPVPAELGNCKKLSVLILTNSYAPILADKRPAGSISVTDDFNYFQGGIHENITSLPGVRVLWAPRATLEGDFPRNWGSCKSLEMVNLGDNLFTGSLPLGLVKCNNLKYLNLSSNKLSGWLDDRLPVPCMEVFDVSRNQLSGQIPRFTYNGCLPYVPSSDDELSATYYSFFMDLFRKDISLTLFRSSMEVGLFHNFGDNNFTGNLPSPPAAIERIGMETIYALLVYGNNLDGPFMGNVFDKCNHVKGLILNISNNLISGAIPSDIDVLCRSLVVLDVSGNRITGTVLPLVSLANSLVALDLSRNRLRGHIPESFTQLKKLKYLSLAENNLTGGIPISLSRLQSLEELDLSSNSLTGGIPSELMNLRNLSALLLDENKLSGRIPSTVANMTSLSVFNVSFNNLSGPIPLNTIAGSCDSVIGNPHLASCPFLSLSVPPPNLQGRDGQSLQDNASPGSDPEKDKGGSFNSIEIASVTSASAIVSVLLALIVVYIYTRKCAPRSPVQGSGRKEVTVFKEIGVRLTYENVVRATGNFNASNCIGSGGFGATYKAEIVPGLLVAIKRLSVGRFQGLQQFQAEIKTLGRLRHENLVTLIGCHVSEAEMFLIYNYLPGGNLENFIHERSKRPVDWRLLHKIALDVARALAYLHDHCVPRILHRDVKPSNILLDNDYTAYLSDFGLARLLGNSETHATTGVAGTFGYVAPEYAMTCRVSDKADVYSYGVVLLELISDKKVLDPSFSQYGNGFNIVAWACMLLRQGRAKEFFMEGLWDVGPHDDLVETLHLAVMCTADSLTIRPTMKLVVQRLKQLQPPS